MHPAKHTFITFLIIYFCKIMYIFVVLFQICILFIFNFAFFLKLCVSFVCFIVLDY
jgi:hypothetical protein